MIVVGKVSAIFRYPVKSMLGESLDRASMDARGLVGDRAFALIDDETGKVVSAKRPKRWSRMFELQACTTDRVSVRFPSGDLIGIDDPRLPERLQEFFGRAVSVSTSPAPGAHYDEVWVRELKANAGPYYERPSRFEDGDEMVNGGSSMGSDGNFFNDSPIHIITTSTLRALGDAAPNSRFAAARFRPNFVIETSDIGFVETAWRGRKLTIGSTIFDVTITVPRCVMTTVAQGDLPDDPEVLRTITAHNAIDALSTGTRYPCVGVYAKVSLTGEICIGDEVRLE